MTETKKRAIYRDQVWIDPDIVSNKYTHAGNNVDYYCYREEGKSTKNKTYLPADPVAEFKAIKQTYVCFAQLLTIVFGSKKKKAEDEDKQYNRVLYHMTVDPKACVKLTLDEQKRFIELSVKYGMLPKYITTDSLISETEGKIVIMLEDLTPSLLYMYLSQYRYLREDPGFVRSILHLHDKAGFDFFAAFVVASRVSIDYTTHHFLTLQRTYGDNSKNLVSVVTVPFSTIVGLKRFVKKPGDYDKRFAMNTNYGYEASSRIEGICKIKRNMSPQELLEPIVKRAFSAMTDEISSKYLAQYDRMKERITYRTKEVADVAKSVNSEQQL